MASANLSRINTNIAALNALNALNSVNSRISVHSLRLATGKRINSAADDAAGFTIASKLATKTGSLGSAIDNIGSAKNLMTVAEGHLTNIQDILVEMKAKSMQAANDTLGTDERTAILSELQEMNSQIDSEITQAQWAGVDLLGNGNSANDLTFQIGVGTAASDELTFNVAGNVFTGTASTFNSSGLDVNASTTTVKTAATTATYNVAGDDFAAATVVVATSASSNISGTYGAELSSGTYTLEVTSTGAGSAGATSMVIRLKDSSGSYVSIDDDGVAAGGGDYGTSLTITASATDGSDFRTVDLGVGISINIDAVATSASDVSSATVSITYARAGTDVDTTANAQTFMDKIDTAINDVSKGLSYIGTQINRLQFQEESLSVAKSNTQAAWSRIVDADMAFEQLEQTKLMILQQTATSMLAQANVAPQSVLALFGG